MIRPNFFIVGAPKCGTTALFEYLRSHRQVCLPNATRKEPHYFADDLAGLRDIGPRENYEELFVPENNDVKAVGEASVFYLYSQAAIPKIIDYESQARLIVMLRNPIDAAYSMHSQFLFSADEDVADFETAWSLQAQRASGNDIPATCREPAMLQYTKLFSLGEQVQRLLNNVPREQVLFIFFDDWVNDTPREYKRVLEFLGVDDDGRTEFPRVNANKQHRWNWLGRLNAHPPAWLKSIVRATQKLFGVENWGVARRIQQTNQQKLERDPLSDAMRQEMSAAFESDVALLSEILNRDLSHWLATRKQTTD